MLNDSSCPVCGFPWSDFLHERHLGCPACYDAFREQLVPLLQAHHRGLCDQPEAETLREQVHEYRRQEWRRRQDAAVAREDYEEAARLRVLLSEPQ